MEAEILEFEDKDSDLSYCEGDPQLEDLDWDEVTRIKEMQDSINDHPVEAHRDLASVCLLTDLYGNDLVVL